VFGTGTSAVAALVDRATRYAMVVALPDGRKADAVARALIEQMGRLPVHLRRSLTWDRGLEMAHHAAITAALSDTTGPVRTCGLPVVFVAESSYKPQHLPRRFAPCGTLCPAIDPRLRRTQYP
jgi:hypothetical protein